MKLRINIIKFSKKLKRFSLILIKFSKKLIKFSKKLIKFRINLIKFRINLIKFRKKLNKFRKNLSFYHVTLRLRSGRQLFRVVAREYGGFGEWFMSFFRHPSNHLNAGAMRLLKC